MSVVQFERWCQLCSGELGLVSTRVGLWQKPSAYNIVLCHLSPWLISPRQQVDMPNDRRSPVCSLEGVKPVWPVCSPG